MKPKPLAEKIYKRLLDFYGLPDWRPHLSPVAELVSTILSQNTNDTNRDRAFKNLRKRFPTWEEVRDAPTEDIIQAIKTAGLANQKGPRIKHALQKITEREDDISLDFLKSMGVEKARKWLTDIKGVGPKTAAIVLLFSLEMPAFPVDTHVHRVTGRVGLRPPNMNASKSHSFLEKLFSPDEYYAAHLNLIKLGREICKSRKPECPVCPLNDFCSYYQEKVE